MRYSDWGSLPARQAEAIAKYRALSQARTLLGVDMPEDGAILAALAEVVAGQGFVFNAKSFGAVGDNSTDDRAAIQSAFDAAETAGGGTVYLPKGVYIIGNGVPSPSGAYSLQLPSNTALVMHPEAVLKRKIIGGGNVNATVRNKDLTNGNSDIRVIGGHFDIVSTTYSGKHVGFTKVADVMVRDVYFDGVEGDWNTFFSDCNDVTVSGVVMDSGGDAFEDGLHFEGGSRINVSDSVIVCGDDCIAIVQEQNFATTNLTDVTVSNCYLYSKKANPVRVDVFNDMTPSNRSIKSVTISNCVMKVGDGASGNGIYVRDQTNTGLLTDVKIANVVLDASGNGGNAIIVDGAVRVSFTDVHVITPGARAWVVDNGTDITLTNCSGSMPRTAGNQLVLVASTGNVTNLQMRGGRFTGSGNVGIQLGSTSTTVTDAQVVGVKIDGSTNDGIFVRNVAGGYFSGNRLTSNGGWGILVNSASSLITAVDNDLRSNTGGGLNSGGIATILRRGNRVSTGAVRGQATLTAGSVTVSTAEILAGDSVLLSRVVSGGTRGHLSVGTITAGVSFVISSSDAADTSTIFWEIVH